MKLKKGYLLRVTLSVIKIFYRENFSFNKARASFIVGGSCLAAD